MDIGPPGPLAHASAKSPDNTGAGPLEPVKVVLLSLPPRTQAMLEFFFSHTGRAHFVATVEEDAQTAIFDDDTPDSRAHWVAFHAATGKPGIAMAFKAPDVRGATWVTKPVTPAALLAAAAQLPPGPAAATGEPVQTALDAPTPMDSAASAMTELGLQAQPLAAEPASPHLAAAVPEPAPNVAAVRPAPPVAEVAPPPGASDAPSPAAAPSSAVAAETSEYVPELNGAAAAAVPEIRTGTQPPEPVSGPDTANRDEADARATTGIAVGSSHHTPRGGGKLAAGFKAFWRRLMGQAQHELPVEGAETALAPPTKAAPPSPTTIAHPSGGHEPSASEAPATDDEGTPNQAAHSDPAGDPQPDSPLASAPPDAAVELGAETPPEAPEAPVTAATLEAEPAPDALGAESTVAPEEVPADGRADAPVASRSETPPPATVDPQPEPALRAVPSAEGLPVPLAPYNPEAYLVGALREAYLVALKWQVPTQFECELGPLLVDAERNEAHLGFDLETALEHAGRPLESRSKVRTMGTSAVRQFRDDDAAQSKSQTRLDNLLWRSGIAAGQGRLPASTDPSRTVYITHWPNLTRLTPMPSAPRVAAFWALRGSTVDEAARQLSISRREVVDFYNGAWALGLLTEDGSHIQRAQRRSERNHGLLTRLIGWLRR